MRDQEAARGRRARRDRVRRARGRDPRGLQTGKLHRQRSRPWRDVEQALAAVVGAFLLHHIALVDELLEHAAERLLGDLQDVEELGDLHARDCG